jgi:hypothetical protein
MADYDSSLPVRTETNGDVVGRIVDGTVTSQFLTVNADGSVNVTDNGGSLTVDAVNLDIRDLVFATDKVDASGSVVALDAPTLAALESITVQNGAGGAAVNIQDGGNSITVDATDLDIRDLDSAQDSVEVLQATHDNLNLNANLQVGDADVANGNPVPVSDAGGSLTVDAVNLDIRDLTHVSDSVKVGDGTDFLAINADGSINVVPQEDAGTEIVDYNTAAAVAGGADDEHDWTSVGTAKLYQVFASASGKMKIEIQIETGAATDTFNTVAVAFNSTAEPNINVALSKYAAVPTGARVRVIRTNRDNQAQDVYSTIVAIQG